MREPAYTCPANIGEDHPVKMIELDDGTLVCAFCYIVHGRMSYMEPIEVEEISH